MSGNIKILVIDDEPNIRETFKMTLKIKKYGVDVYADGISAVKNFKKGSYHIAFVDIKLPQMDGLEVLRHLKENDPGIEVIIMTAYATDVSEATALRLGALEYLRKPFLMEEIYELIERGLRRHNKEKKE